MPVEYDYKLVTRHESALVISRDLMGGRAMAERLEISSQGGVTIVRFKDQKILDEADIQQLGSELTEVVSAEDNDRIVLNFENVGFLSSAALGKLISVKKKAVTNNVELKLCCIAANLFEVFRLTNLDQVFDIKDTQDEAIAAFAN